MGAVDIHAGTLNPASSRLLGPSEWRGYGQPLFPESAWRIESGLLRALAEADPVDLISRESFEDFVFCFEWCVGKAAIPECSIASTRLFPTRWRGDRDVCACRRYSQASGLCVDLSR